MPARRHDPILGADRNQVDVSDRVALRRQHRFDGMQRNACLVLLARQALFGAGRAEFAIDDEGGRGHHPVVNAKRDDWLVGHWRRSGPKATAVPMPTVGTAAFESRRGRSDSGWKSLGTLSGIAVSAH